ncbi:MAG: ABC transporter substrate-binding protein, partial [Candidatus Binatia bacterium]
MIKKVLCLAPSALLLALGFPVEAQQAGKIPRIGYLNATSASTSPARVEAFRQGLRELGYLEGKNIVIEFRHAEGKLDRLPSLAAELVRLKVDIIVSGGPATTRPAKEATSTIPIVMAQDNDAVATGIVASLARPGGNITGLSTLAPEISGKQLELLKEIVPKLSRVAVLGTSTIPSQVQTLREVDLAAGALKVKIQYLDVLDPNAIETAFQNATKRRADALLVLQSAVMNPQREKVADLAAKNRLPAIYFQSQYMEVGGLMYYGPNTADLFRRAAPYVDNIF